MRIVYISKYTILPKYGAPSRQYFISKYLSQQNNSEVLLIGSKSTLAPVPRIKGLFNSAKEGRVEMVTLNGPTVDPGFNLKRLWSWVLFEINIFRFRKRIKAFKPEVAIISSLSILTFLSGVFLKKWLKIPLIIEIRDIYPLSLVEIGNYSPNHPAVLLLKQVEKIGYENADLIVSTLANAKEHVRTVIKKPFDFYYLPMGADLDFYNLASQIPAAGIMEKKPGEFIVGYAGTLGTANALTVIFEAADSLRISHPHIKFAIIGDGPLKAGFQEKYKHLQNIIFFPAVRKMSLQPLLANMDLVINTWLNIPIYRFGISPNKWIDYMFAARPILVAHSGYKGIIDESGCGMFVPAEDKGSLIKAIVQFSEMTVDERTLMGQKGKDYLINNLSYESLCKPYYKILDSIINKKIQVA